MEKFIPEYLRILDIDPLGYFIRLRNTSRKQSLDLSGISIRQINNDIQVLNSYMFHEQIRPLLHGGDVVTIYSKDYRQLKFDIAPYTFIAKDVSRWLTDDHIRTEISLNNVVFDSYKTCSSATNDVPLLFIQQSLNSKPLLTKTMSSSDRYARFAFPYCLPTDNIVNPHTTADPKRNGSKLKKNMCDENQSNVKCFDSYAKRLTTAPKKQTTPKKK